MIRPARPGDVATIRQLVGELAEYEKEPEAVVSTEADFAEALFGEHPAAFAHIAEHITPEGEHTVAGFALWFRNFSTWTGRHGIYVEDLYVRPHLRGRGYGRALLAELARTCAQHGFSRLEWSVLDWNRDAIEFYTSLGAVAMDEWTVFRVSGDSLARLAAREDSEEAPS
ncbi:GNAT family N-acetyltransferase [Salinactinospora qingdaonensis]|uniref:GNAT family N-acetyltransferase n=1 Tax=Salinactinospora qingdaonensis TaxID=702744 RepID=A0ABP7GA16_9ACTN